jgi:O-antigen ligase
LQWFLSWVGGCLVVITVLSLLAYHGQITLPQKALLEMAEVDEQTGEATLWQRLCGTGVFNDPNDLCLVLLLCMSIALYRLTGPAAGLARLGWLAGLALCFAAFMLTRSRGGFVAFLVWGLVLCHARFGIWKTLVTAGAALPVLFLLFSGRATNFTDRADAGQDRIELWSDALGLFREAPLFGIGWRMFEDRAGLVAHNSFLHCYAELGFFGGTLFIGAFFTALWVLYRLRPAARSVDPELWRLRPYLLAALTAYTVGLLTLSRPYITPTYLILGLVTAYVGMAGPPLLLPRFDLRHLGRLTVVGLAFLFAMHLFVRTAIHRG